MLPALQWMVEKLDDGIQTTPFQPILCKSADSVGSGHNLLDSLAKCGPFLFLVYGHAIWRSFVPTLLIAALSFCAVVGVIGVVCVVCIYTLSILLGIIIPFRTLRLQTRPNAYHRAPLLLITLPYIRLHNPLKRLNGRNIYLFPLNLKQLGCTGTATTGGHIYVIQYAFENLPHLLQHRLVLAN